MTNKFRLPRLFTGAKFYLTLVPTFAGAFFPAIVARSRRTAADEGRYSGSGAGGGEATVVILD